jgi:hypothetical protein
MRINGFTIRHLFVKNFQRILWAAICYRFTRKPLLLGFAAEDEFLSVGPAVPMPELWDQGYRVGYCGKVFGSYILRYVHASTKMPMNECPS